MLPAATYLVHSAIFFCPHCGAAVPNPINGQTIVDRGGLGFMDDEMTCEGNATQPGCKRRFRLPEVAGDMRAGVQR